MLHVTCRSVHIGCIVREDRMWLHSKDFRFVVFVFPQLMSGKRNLKSKWSDSDVTCFLFFFIIIFRDELARLWNNQIMAVTSL